MLHRMVYKYKVYNSKIILNFKIKSQNYILPKYRIIYMAVYIFYVYIKKQFCLEVSSEN